MKELKSFLSLNLAIIMLLTMLFPVPAIAVNSDAPESAIEETVTATEGGEPIADHDFNNGKMHYTISADGVLTITGTGAMQNYSSADHAPWYTYRAQVKKIVVEDGITAIGEYAFAEMNAATSVTLPKGIEEIPLYAFYDCSALRSIDLPDSVTTFGDYAFRYCNSLKSIDIPEGVTSLSYGLFQSCYALTEITLPSTLESLGDNRNTFNGTSLTKIYYRGTLEDWLNISFNSSGLPMTQPCDLYINGQLLSCLNIPDGILKIPAYAFQYVNLTSAKLPSSVTSIGANAFYNCKQLGSVMLTDRMTEVEMNAFADCTALSKIFYIGDESSWESITINSGNSRLNDATHFYLSAESDVSIVSVADTEHGSVTVSDSFCYPGDVVTVTAQPEAGYRLKRILVNGQEIEANAFTVGNGDEFQDADGKVSITNGKSAIMVASEDKVNVIYASNDTVFLVDNGKYGYDVYVGYNKVPTMTADTMCCMLNSNGYVALAVIDGTAHSSTQYQAYLASTTRHAYEAVNNSVYDVFYVYKIGATEPTKILMPYNTTLTSTGFYDVEVIDGVATLTLIQKGPDINPGCKDIEYAGHLLDVALARTAVVANSVATTVNGEANKNFSNMTNAKYFLVDNGVVTETAYTDIAEGDIIAVLYDKTIYTVGGVTAEIYTPVYVYLTDNASGNQGDGTDQPDPTKTANITIYYNSCTVANAGNVVIPSGTQFAAALPFTFVVIGGTTVPQVSVDNNGILTLVGSNSVNGTFTYKVDGVSGGNYNISVDNAGPTEAPAETDMDLSRMTSTAEVLPSAVFDFDDVPPVRPEAAGLVNNDLDVSNVVVINAIRWNSPYLGSTVGCYVTANLTFADGSTVNDVIVTKINGKTIVSAENGSGAIERNSVSNAYYLNDAYYGHLNTYHVNSDGSYELYTHSGVENYVVSAEFEQYMDVNTSGTCGDNIEWTLDEDGTLTLTGSGGMPRCNKNNYPWYSNHDEIKNIVVSDGITSVAEWAFADDYKNLINVTLANSVTWIGYSAFYNCTALETLSIGGAITNMGSPAFGSNAFGGCTSLATVYVDEYAVLCGEEYERYLPSSAMIIYKEPESDEVIQTWYIGTYDETDVEAELHNDGALFINGTGTFRTGVWPNGKITSVVVSDGITSIPNDTFSGAKRLKSVTLGKDIQTIGQRAFYNCTALESINLPEGITSIEYSTFANCGALQQIDLPEGVTQILGYAFNGCKSLTELKLPENLNRIEYYAFEGCVGVSSIVLPDSVHQIGEGAFYGCSGLETLIVGKNVTWIGSNAFTFCPELREVHWNAENCSIGSYLFASSGDKEEGLTLAIGADVISIPEKLFYVSNNDTGSQNQLKSVTLEKNGVLKQIGASAFYNCKMLESVELGNELTYIGDAAFNSCSAITSISLPDTLESIGRKAFYRTSLTNVTVGSNVHYIGEQAFAQCPDDLLIRGYSGSEAESYAAAESIPFEVLNQVMLSVNGNRLDIDYERSVGYRPESDAPLSWYSQQAQAAYYAIASDANLVAWNTLSDGTGISYDKDDSVTMSKDIELYAQWKGVEPDASGNCGGNIEWALDANGTLTLTGKGDMPEQNRNTYPWYAYASKIRRVIIGGEITYVSNSAFSNYSNLTSVTIGDSVETIGSSAFSNCYNLIEVSFGNSLKEINNYAFGSCDALKDIKLGDSVTMIGHQAFDYCYALEHVTIGSGIETISSRAFYGCRSLQSVTIDNYAVCVTTSEDSFPAGFEPTYRTGDGSSIVKTWEIGAYDESDVTATLYGDGRLVISGEGSFDKYPWPKTITSLVVKEGVTQVAQDAFNNCKALTSVTLEEGVQFIEWSAFRDCTALEQLNLPQSLTRIYGDAFRNCTSLTELDLPENLNRIEYRAFYNCTSLRAVEIPDSVRQIGDNAFSGCSSLETLTVGTGVTWIGTNAFARCTNLKAVNWNAHNCNVADYVFASSGDKETGLALDVGTDVLYIPSKLFYVSSSDANSRNQLKSVVIENDGVLGAIGASAFYGCATLESVNLGNTLYVINDAAFNSCSALTSIELPDSLEHIGRKAFFRTGLTSVTVGSDVHYIGELAFAQCPDELVIRGYTGSEAERHANENNITFEPLEQVLLNLSGNRSDIDYERAVGYRADADAPLSWYSREVQAAYYAIASDANLIAWNTISDGTGTSYGKDDTVTMSKDVTLYAQWTQSGSSLLDEDNRNAHGILFTLNDEAKTAIVGDGSEVNNNSGYYGMPSGGTVTIPDTVTKDGTVYQVIGVSANAFRGSGQITRVLIGVNVSSVVPSAFEGCPNLQAFEVAEGNKSFSARDGVLYDAEGLYLYLYPGGKTDTAFTVPESVKTIGRSAFYDNTYLESLTVGRSVTAIYRNAFCGLDHLTEITLPFIGVRELDGDDGYYSPCFSEVFDFGWYYGSPISTEQLSRYNSSGYWSHNTTVGGGLIKVTILGGPLYQGAFAGCSGIEEINLPSVPETIPDECFSGCSALQKLNFANQNAYAQEGKLILPEGVQSIGERAFYGCQSITGVFIPNSLTSISDSAFIASGVEEFTVSLGNERYSADKWGVLYNKDQTELLLYPACRHWPYYNVADTATRIGNNAFNGSETLINLYVPKTVTDLDDGAITNCPNLTVCCFIESAAYYYALNNNLTAWYMDNQTLQSISVYHLPERSTQVEGQEDWTGLYIVGNYGGRELQIDDYTLSFDNNTSGPKTVMVEFMGKTATFEIVYEAAESELPTAKVYGCSLSLDGDIGVNFYVVLPEEFINDPDAYITLNTTRLTLADATASTSGGQQLYKWKYRVVAKRMPEDVVLNVYNGAGEKLRLESFSSGEDFTESGYATSVSKYIQQTLATSSSAKLIALVKALSDYGSKAQMHFNHNTSAAAAIYNQEAIDAVTTETVEPFRYTKTQTEQPGVSFAALTLVLESETTLKLYFKLNEGVIGDYSFTLDGKAVTPTYSKGYYVVEIKDIAAKNLDKVYTVKVSNSSGVILTVNSCALSYVCQVMNLEGQSEKLLQVVKALYLYNQAANAYFK